MRKVILYIAASLDGYIARTNGEVDWLDDFSKPGEDYGYSNFYGSIDVTLMGNKTYKQSLSFGEFPYKEKQNFVFTRQKMHPTAEYVEFVNDDIVSLIDKLRNEQGKDIWLIGGTQINEFFMNNELINEIMLFIMPVTLGTGIPLFTKGTKKSAFKLLETKPYANGVEIGRAHV